MYGRPIHVNYRSHIVSQLGSKIFVDPEHPGGYKIEGSTGSRQKV